MTHPSLWRAALVSIALVAPLACGSDSPFPPTQPGEPVRTLAPAHGIPPGWPLPSARLVSFGGVISNTNQFDSRPQLGGRLRHCLAAIPRQRPIWRTRSGLFGSNDGLPDMM